jgi:hypothetical protein
MIVVLMGRGADALIAASRYLNGVHVYYQGHVNKVRAANH